MNIELAQLQNGGLVIISDPPFERPVCRVEYYRDQHLMMLVYEAPDDEGDLMPCELSAPAIQKVENSPHVLIVNQTGDHKLHGYDVPLIHIGF